MTSFPLTEEKRIRRETNVFEGVEKAACGGYGLRMQGVKMKWVRVYVILVQKMRCEGERYSNRRGAGPRRVKHWAQRNRELGKKINPDHTTRD